MSTPFQDKIQRNIYEVGQSIIHVGDDPRFTYTVGAATRGCSDILIIGNIAPEFVVTIINDLCENLRSNGNKLGLYDNILTVPCYVLPCDHNLELLTYDYVVQNENYLKDNNAERMLPKGAPDYVQLIFPDRAGLFPWDVGYESDRFPQPVFSTKRPEDYPSSNT